MGLLNNNAVIRLADGLKAFGRTGAAYGVSAVKVDPTMERAFSLVEDVSDLISSLVDVADAALERIGKTSVAGYTCQQVLFFLELPDRR